jgi:GTP cyclohydrolase I
MAGTTNSSAINTSSVSKRKRGNKQHDRRPPALTNDRSRAFDKRRNSASRPAHNPRADSIAKEVKLLSGRRSSVPVIELGGLSRPGIGTRTRIDEEPEQAEARLAKMCSAVRTLIECMGEDPDREGLLTTPLRYAKALLFLTKGYQVNVDEVVNNALFHEGHSEMVIVKDIEIHSLCEHHLVPFAGKV